jgi:hypothetical protein
VKANIILYIDKDTNIHKKIFISSDRRKVRTSVAKTARGTEVGNPRGNDRREKNLQQEKGKEGRTAI